MNFYFIKNNFGQDIFIIKNYCIKDILIKFTIYKNLLLITRCEKLEALNEHLINLHLLNSTSENII